MLVSCIMPTANRRHLVPVAVASFLAQDWPEKELVVVDDGKESVMDLFFEVPQLKYVHKQNMILGAKRNLCCEMAEGDVIVHFDDDDWSAPTRITDQVNRLVEKDAELSGYHSIYFYDQQHHRVYAYMGTPNYSCGTAMCYTREFWEKNRFPDVRFAEDNALVEIAQNEKKIVSASGLEMIVARAHGDNTSSCQRIGNNAWPEMPIWTLPPGFLEAIGKGDSV